MFYTYVWLREDGTPYYVGKGTKNRAYIRHLKHGAAPPLGRIVFFIAESEVDAFETEVALIWYYGRKDLGFGCLRNMTNGGDKPPKVNWLGRHHTPEAIENIRASQVGRKMSPATIEKMKKNSARPMLGKRMSEETKALMSKSKAGKPWTKAQRESCNRRQNEQSIYTKESRG
jgi:hypothetical protein